MRVPRVAYQSPSLFIAASQLPSLSSSNAAMTRCFVLNGRLSHVYRLMAYFPSYLEAFMQTFNQVLRLPAPLPRAWRNYIAIMAASQHHCQYLVSLQEMEFLHNGGDDLWLRGLEHAPRKLRNLAHLNALMAHQPWRITKHHISVLLPVHIIDPIDYLMMKNRLWSGQMMAMTIGQNRNWCWPLFLWPRFILSAPLFLAVELRQKSTCAAALLILFRQRLHLRPHAITCLMFWMTQIPSRPPTLLS